MVIYLCVAGMYTHVSCSLSIMIHHYRPPHSWRSNLNVPSIHQLSRSTQPTRTLRAG